MIRMLLVATLVSAVVSGISLGAAAQTCAERCGAAYAGCAALEAAGCEIGGQLAGEAVEQLGDEIPIPGMGALFGSLTRTTTAQKCVQLLGPCQQIRATCLAGCPPSEGSATVGAAPAPALRYSTLRVFADLPHTIVYINEQRMGATLDDPLQPFVSPELPVGRYWVRLASADGEWEWRGEKTVEEGNLNAIEGTLVNRRLRLLDEARTFDAAGETVRAAGAYRKLLIAFPNDTEIKPEAEARLTALFPAFQIADAEMFRRIQTEAEPQKRAALCRVYLDEFAGGAFRPAVQTALAAAEQTLPRLQQPGTPARPVVDDRAQVEALLGVGLSREYTRWRSQEMGRFPKFGDYVYSSWKDGRRELVKFFAILMSLGLGGVVGGSVWLGIASKNGGGSGLIGGAVVTGVGGLLVLVDLIIFPAAISKAKKDMKKLEGMRTAALRSPGLEFAGLSPLSDSRNKVNGLALNWNF